MAALVRFGLVDEGMGLPSFLVWLLILVIGTGLLIIAIPLYQLWRRRGAPLPEFTHQAVAKRVEAEFASSERQAAMSALKIWVLACGPNETMQAQTQQAVLQIAKGDLEKLKELGRKSGTLDPRDVIIQAGYAG